MPDDSSNDFKAAQGKHSVQIATERKLMEMTGLTRNQIRQNLQNAGSAFIDKVQTRSTPAQPATVQETPAETKTSPLQSFARRAFVPGQAEDKHEAIGLTGQKKVIIVDNGTPNYYNITAEFIAAV